MKRFLAALTVWLALLWAAAASAAVTVTEIGGGNTTSASTTIVITAGSGCSAACGGNSCAATAGNYLFIAAANILTTASLSTITDTSTGGPNTYTLLNQVTNSGGSQTSSAAAYSPVTHAIANTNTMTLTFGASTSNKAAVAVCVTGLATSSAQDINGLGAQANASSTASFTTAGNPASPAGVAFLWISNNFNGNYAGQPAGWTKVDCIVPTGSFNEICLYFQTGYSTGSTLSGSATLGGSTDWTANIATFKGQAAAGGAPTRSLLHVGS